MSRLKELIKYYEENLKSHERNDFWRIADLADKAENGIYPDRDSYTDDERAIWCKFVEFLHPNDPGF